MCIYIYIYTHTYVYTYTLFMGAPRSQPESCSRFIWLVVTFVSTHVLLLASNDMIG